MQINTKKDLVNMLAKRDNVSVKEARYQVDVVQQLINEQLEGGYLSEIEDILLDYLGIELDYIYLFI